MTVDKDADEMDALLAEADVTEDFSDLGLAEEEESVPLASGERQQAEGSSDGKGWNGIRNR